jgi:hypothetical protein
MEIGFMIAHSFSGSKGLRLARLLALRFCPPNAMANKTGARLFRKAAQKKAVNDGGRE